MKKMVALLSAFIVSTTLLVAKDDMGLSGVYGGVGLAIQAVPDGWDEHGIGLVLKGGMALPRLLDDLGAEVELTTSISDPQYVNGADVSILTLAGYMTYTIEIPGTQFAVRPRAGIILPNLGDSDSVNSRSLGLTTGIAGLITLNEQLDAYVDYTNLGENINNYTVGIELKF